MVDNIDIYNPNVWLVLITIIYTIFTFGLFLIQRRQFLLTTNPVISIKLLKMLINKEQTQLEIDLELRNIGNGPAIGITIDSEIILKNSDKYNDVLLISHWEPFSIPFLSINESYKSEIISKLRFTKDNVIKLLNDFNEIEKKLEERKIKGEHYVIEEPLLNIYIYYQNNNGQYFKETYITPIATRRLVKIEKDKTTNIIKQTTSIFINEDGTIPLNCTYIPRPKFKVHPIKEKKMKKDISLRNGKRKVPQYPKRKNKYIRMIINFLEKL